MEEKKEEQEAAAEEESAGENRGAGHVGEGERGLRRPISKLGRKLNSRNPRGPLTLGLNRTSLKIRGSSIAGTQG